MHTIKEQDFNRLVQFVESHYGINLSKKKALIEGRLSNLLDAEGFSSFGEYTDHIIKGGSKAQLDLMIGRLTTNHTFFMRESSHFEYFRDTILPQLAAGKKKPVVSIWSAGCSSGEEPYTLSMILLDYFRGKVPQWDTRILATDISKKVLAAAMAGIYPEDTLRVLPAQWKNTYFRRSNGLCTVVPALRNNVIFREFNLMDPIRFKIRFDVIFCRNVMIYFDQPTKDALVQRFCDALNPGGYLMIGHSETLNKTNSPFQYILPSVYQKVPSGI